MLELKIKILLQEIFPNNILKGELAGNYFRKWLKPQFIVLLFSISRRKNEEAKRWRSFVESIRSKLTVKQVVDGVRGGGELSFDYLTLIITAE